MKNTPPLRILFLAAEADPFVKVGGLGDVAGSLPLALHELQTTDEHPAVDIRLAIPFHGTIRESDYPLEFVASYSISHSSGEIPSQVFATRLKNLTVYLISGPPIPPEAPVYSIDTGFDGYKYTFFSMAGLRLGKSIGWQPDILHANDWHTAPAVYALALNRATNPYYMPTASVLSIHNLPYLGAGSAPALGAFGLPPADDFHLPYWAQHMALPLGLLTTDQIVTVSPGYAQEILTSEYGSGLHDFLRTRVDTISGILNGIDPARWDPANDPTIPAQYSSTTLHLRSQNKTALQVEFNLEVNPKQPLLAMITRMDVQKGVDLALEAIRSLLSVPPKGPHGLQIIFLGNGDPKLEDGVRMLESEFPDHVRAAIRYDPQLSRRIYAGADALLMPSRYEPCGLAQMIAMRYGCIPIARATGGLVDTIQDQADSNTNTGFLFKEPTPAALAGAILRAISIYQSADNWCAMQLSAMSQDFSWNRSAIQYLQLYQAVIQRYRSSIRMKGNRQ